MKIPEGWELVHTVPHVVGPIGEINTYEKGECRIGISENGEALREATGKKFQLSLSKNSEPLFEAEAEDVFIEWGFVEFETLYASTHASHWMSNRNE